MTLEEAVYILVFVSWLLTMIQGTWVLVDGGRFLAYVTRALGEPTGAGGAAAPSSSRPRVTVILPCCGVDERLEHTVAALRRQSYDHYDVVFTFESADDPAYTAIDRWARDWDGPSWRRVVAGLAVHRSQKIHNLLAAVEVLSDECEVIAFLDSDAVPDTDWLGHLIGPLDDRSVGAATGFRWYSATGGVVAGIRSAWNAASVSMLHNDWTNFCWGGSTAIRRETFDRLEIVRRWDRALSDDYQLTRVIRDAGLRICFVPQALLPSTDDGGFFDFWRFARRQLVITRVCAKRLWVAGLVLCCNFINGATCTFALLVAAMFGLMDADPRVMPLALAGWASILVLAGAKALVRQIAIGRILRSPDHGWRDIAWDVLGVGLIGMIHLGLLLSSLTSRRFVWRNRVYELVSADETRIVEHLSEPRRMRQPGATATPQRTS